MKKEKYDILKELREYKYQELNPNSVPNSNNKVKKIFSFKTFLIIIFLIMLLFLSIFTFTQRYYFNKINNDYNNLLIWTKSKTGESDFWVNYGNDGEDPKKIDQFFPNMDTETIFEYMNFLHKTSPNAHVVYEYDFSYYDYYDSSEFDEFLEVNNIEAN